MRHFFLLLCLALWGIPSVSLRAAAARPSGEGPMSDGWLSALRAALGEADVPSGRIPAGKVETRRVAVWKVWQQLVAARDAAHRLPAPPSLGEPYTASWALPDSLERGAVMPFYWGAKGDSVPAAGRPLFLYLHGSGPKADEWAAGLSWCRVFDDAPSVYFIPQIPQEGAYYRWWQRAKLWAWEHLFRQVLADAAFDPARLYLLGISEGGYGSQRLASYYADYLAAAGPMAGGEPLRNAPPENCAHIGFSLLTGEDDWMFARSLLTQTAARVYDSLRTALPDAYAHRIELEPGRGHGINYRPTTPWLKAFARQARPHRFVWEDFAMDGRRRSGFYNVEVPARPDEGEGADTVRYRYDFRVADNEVHLDVRRVHYHVLSRDPRWGIELDVAKTFTPAEGGRARIYLDADLVDLRRPVTVWVNGRKAFRGRVRPHTDHLVRSCALWGDPLRLFPAAVEVEW